MNKKIKVIVADIDGTLIPMGGQDISLTNANTIKELQENGYLFGIASGRPIYQIKRTIKLWNLKYEPDFYIGFNGAELLDTRDNETIRLNFLSADEVKEAFNYMKPFEKITNPFIYYHESMMFLKHDTVMIRSAKKYDGIEKVFVANNIEDLWAEGNAKIHFRCLDPNDMDKVEAYLKENPHEFLIGAKTQSDLMEIYHKDVSKGNMIKKYIEKLNITLDEVAAFGDTSNDNSMLEICGMSVCLLNGSEDTKKIAKYITRKEASDDGFTDFVNQNILEKI